MALAFSIKDGHGLSNEIRHLLPLKKTKIMIYWPLTLQSCALYIDNKTKLGWPLPSI